VAFLSFSLSKIICARCLLNKDINMSAKLEEERELMLMTFVSPVTKSDDNTELKAARVPL
jgi:hypothetical protein